MQLESTDDRRSRVIHQLSHALHICDCEIGDATSQKLVREEALRRSQADKFHIQEQLRKYQESLKLVQTKNAHAEDRMKLSIKEIDRLNKVIDVLFQASENTDVESIISGHRAIILHHEDIISVARNELTLDNAQIDDIKQAIANLMKDLEKAPIVQTDEDRYVDEIRQLQITLDELCDVRDQIKELLDQLDRRRDPNTGEAESITSAEKKKKSKRSSFSQTEPYVIKEKSEGYKTPRASTNSNCGLSPCYSSSNSSSNHRSRYG